MSESAKPNPITTMRVVYEIPGMDSVTVRRGIEYRHGGVGPLALDLYQPAPPKEDSHPPVVVFITGYPDPGFQAKLGCPQKDMGSYVSWAQLTAMSGIAAVTYVNRDPAADAHAVLAYVRDNAGALGVDGDRIGVWACSGSGPVALSVLMTEAQGSLRCGVLAYAYSLDEGAHDGVAAAASQWGFAVLAAGRSVADLPAGLPLFIARAGRDACPQLNESLDRFITQALARDLPLTLANLPGAPHAFDVMQDDEASRDGIRQMLAFMRLHLGGPAPMETGKA